jgi:hypothetical protein
MDGQTHLTSGLDSIQEVCYDGKNIFFVIFGILNGFLLLPICEFLNFYEKN